MIDVFGANGFGCLKNVELKLTKLHALVGPNDSGKSTILKGIRALSAIAERTRDPNVVPEAMMAEPCSLWAGVGGDQFRFTRGPGQEDSQKGRDSAREGARGAKIVRWSPTSLRNPSSFVEELDQFWRHGGQGLPGVLGNVFLRSESALSELNVRLRELFPALESIRVAPVNNTLRIDARLRDGRIVEANQLSDGIFYYLAFTVLRYLPEPSIVLIDEPENGLHPARIADIVGMLRTVTETQPVQIVMATHSPLIINELQPDEVTIVTRTPEDGTRVTPIAATKNFADRAKVYALGELWLSYCDGRLEEELVPAKST